ncbi:MAG TPA: M13 family metallopeptidase N-terminal domain-containing protein, partial [Gemmatimonadales bacterium]
MLRFRSPRILLTLTLSAALAAAATDPGIDVAGMDRSVRPGDDFFRYANGHWLETTEIPADRSSWSAGAMVAERTDGRVADLIREAAKAKAPAGSDTRKVGDYFTSFMDTTAIEAAGLKPIRPTLDSIAAIGNRTELAHYLGTTLRADMDALNATSLHTSRLFGLWVAQDLDDPSRYSAFLLQGGLGLPDRSYYLDSSASMGSIRKEYERHVGAMLGLAGIAGATQKAGGIMRLETAIARAHWSREATGDVSKGNNHWPRAEFGKRAPGLDWETYFSGAKLDRPKQFVVWQPSAFTGISALVASEPLDVWKDWLAYHAIQSRAGVLPAKLDRESFTYLSALTGATKQRDRWKRAVDATNDALGFAVGKLYAERYFPP